MPLRIRFMLGKHTPQIRLARFGAAVGLLALAPCQFLFSHGHPGAVGTDVQNGHRWSARLGVPFLPSLGRRPHLLHQPLDLPGLHVDAAGLGQVQFGFLIAGLIGPFQTHEPGQGGSVAPCQPQSGISGIMPRLFNWVIVIGALQGELPKHAVNLEAAPPFVLLPGFGLVGGVNPVGGLLQEPTHQGIG